MNRPHQRFRPPGHSLPEEISQPNVSTTSPTVQKRAPALPKSVDIDQL